MTRNRQIIITITIAAFVLLGIFLRHQNNKDYFQSFITDPVTKVTYDFTCKTIDNTESGHTYSIQQKIFENFFKSEGYIKGEKIEFDRYLLNFTVGGTNKSVIVNWNLPFLYHKRKKKNFPAIVYYKRDGGCDRYEIYDIETKTAYSLSR